MELWCFDRLEKGFSTVRGSWLSKHVYLHGGVGPPPKPRPPMHRKRRHLAIAAELYIRLASVSLTGMSDESLGQALPGIRFEAHLKFEPLLLWRRPMCQTLVHVNVYAHINTGTSRWSLNVTSGRPHLSGLTTLQFGTAQQTFNF